MTHRDFRRDSRQAVEWETMAAQNTNMTADGTFIVSGALLPAIRLTVRRCRCTILALMEGTLAAGDKVRIGMGLIMVGADAFALGATAMPDPLGDADHSWLWWKEITLTMPGASTNATWVNPGGFGPAVREIEVDTKAMRQMKEGDALVWLAQYADFAGTPPVELNLGVTRVLIGLH